MSLSISSNENEEHSESKFLDPYFRRLDREALRIGSGILQKGL
jgi:hypothetical protein